MKILATADIHLGRVPSRIPPSWLEECSPRIVWSNIVRLALEHRVHAVLLAGDVVDRGNLFFEARGSLEEGLRQLVENGVHVLAVAGNHDTEVLPDLADSLPESFHLLGRGEKWEHLDLQNQGQTVRVFGWSFARQHVLFNPIDAFPGLGENPPAACLGLLHADLDSPGSRYAPVRRDQLLQSGIPLWILGHIHKPGTDSAVCYPGSPQPLDPGETGCHSVLLLDYQGAETPSISQYSVSSLRYESLCLPAESCETRPQLLAALEESISMLPESDDHPPRYLVVDLTIAGETSRSRREMEEQTGELLENELVLGETKVYFRAIDHQIQSSLNLEELAQGGDVVALLARLLQNLDAEDPSAEAMELLGEVDKALAKVFSQPVFSPLQEVEGQDKRSLVRSQGCELLRLLLQQRERQKK